MFLLAHESLMICRYVHISCRATYIVEVIDKETSEWFTKEQGGQSGHDVSLVPFYLQTSGLAVTNE